MVERALIRFKNWVNESFENNFSHCLISSLYRGTNNYLDLNSECTAVWRCPPYIIARPLRYFFLEIPIKRRIKVFKLGL